MANKLQIHLLRQGVETWNTWRTTNPDVPIHLSKARLYGVDLSGVDLSGVDLSDAHLRRANLSDARLYRADLSGADLILADLSRAILIEAILIEANLSNAILSNADLVSANLNYARLSEADLSNADFSGANLSNADLVSANLNYAKLSEADLSRANLNGARLYSANLSGAVLSNADFSEATLYLADLSGTDLSGAMLGKARIRRTNYLGDKYDKANFSGANFSGANFSGQDLSGLDFSGQDLSGAILSNTNLTNADLSGANLSSANLSSALLISTNFNHAILSDCTIFGIAAWDVQLEGAKQEDLVITPPGQPTVTVDNLKVAQFIYLLLNNKEIREVIDTITSKVVLILGRFTDQRKKVLDTLKDELRKHDYLPILFDFKKPSSRDITETISTLAHLARFVIADITQAKSIPQELERIVKDLPSVPVQPLLQARAKQYSMFEHYWRYPCVLEIYRYRNVEHVRQSIQKSIIEPAEQRAKELAPNPTQK